MAIRARSKRVILALDFYNYIPYSVVVAQMSARLYMIPGLWMALATIAGLTMTFRVLKLSWLLKKAYHQKRITKHCYHNNIKWKQWCEDVLLTLIKSSMEMDKEQASKLIDSISVEIPPDTAEALCKLTFTEEEMDAAVKALKVFRVANPSQLDLITNLQKWIIEEFPHFYGQAIYHHTEVSTASTNNNQTFVSPNHSHHSAPANIANYDPLSEDDLVAFKKMRNGKY